MPHGAESDAKMQGVDAAQARFRRAIAGAVWRKMPSFAAQAAEADEFCVTARRPTCFARNTYGAASAKAEYCVALGAS